jgi:hypothetical protein
MLLVILFLELTESMMYHLHWSYDELEPDSNSNCSDLISNASSLCNVEVDDNTNHSESWFPFTSRHESILYTCFYGQQEPPSFKTFQSTLLMMKLLAPMVEGKKKVIVLIVSSH